jgi:hypothetical protein
MQTNPITRCGRCALPWLQQGSRNTLSRRYLSSTASLLAIPPESPSWIEVPQPLQSPAPPKPPIKGILPIPREVIKDRRHRYKATSKHLDTTAAYPKTQRPINPDVKGAELNIFDRQVSSQRRDLLREGMKGIFERRVSQAHKERIVKKSRIIKDLKARNAPARQEDILTQQSVPEVVRLALAWKPTKKVETEQEKQERKQTYDEIVEQKLQHKMDQVHKLYLNAGNFIIDENQLNEQIDKVFGSDEKPIYWNGNGISVWQTGPPSGTKGLGSSFSQAPTLTGYGDNFKERNDMMKRIMKIAGELSGGKIEEPEFLNDSFPRYGAITDKK